MAPGDCGDTVTLDYTCVTAARRSPGAPTSSNGAPVHPLSPGRATCAASTGVMEATTSHRPRPTSPPSIAIGLTARGSGQPAAGREPPTRARPTRTSTPSTTRMMLRNAAVSMTGAPAALRRRARPVARHGAARPASPRDRAGAVIFFTSSNQRNSTYPEGDAGRRAPSPRPASTTRSRCSRNPPTARRYLAYDVYLIARGACCQTTLPTRTTQQDLYSGGSVTWWGTFANVTTGQPDAGGDASRDGDRPQPDRRGADLKYDDARRCR